MGALGRLVAGTMKGILTVEEHSLIGGLGSLIADVFRGSAVPITSIGIKDQFGRSARSYSELLEAYGLTAGHIAAAVRKIIGSSPRG